MPVLHSSYTFINRLLLLFPIKVTLLSYSEVLHHILSPVGRVDEPLKSINQSIIQFRSSFNLFVSIIYFPVADTTSRNVIEIKLLTVTFISFSLFSFTDLSFLFLGFFSLFPCWLLFFIVFCVCVERQNYECRCKAKKKLVASFLTKQKQSCVPLNVYASSLPHFSSKRDYLYIVWCPVLATFLITSLNIHPTKLFENCK